MRQRVKSLSWVVDTLLSDARAIRQITDQFLRFLAAPAVGGEYERNEVIVIAVDVLVLVFLRGCSGSASRIDILASFDAGHRKRINDRQINQCGLVVDEQLKIGPLLIVGAAELRLSAASDLPIVATLGPEIANAVAPD